MQGRSPPCACWSANMAACILWGRCPLITGASARLYLWAAAHHSPVGLPTGRHTLSGAAAPSLPGPLPHHYQGRSPPCSRWSANRAAHSLWGRCPIITRAPARLYLRAAAHHGPIGLPTGMHALSWPTAPALLGLQPDFSQSHSPLCSCGCAIRAPPHQACLSQGRSLPDLVWPILRFGYIVRPLPYHGYSPTQSQRCSLPGSRSGRGLSTMTRACLYLFICGPRPRPRYNGPPTGPGTLFAPQTHHYPIGQRAAAHLASEGPLAGGQISLIMTRPTARLRQGRSPCTAPLPGGQRE